MTTVHKAGYRFNDSVMQRATREAKKHHITPEQLFQACKLQDQGDRYLSSSEIERGLKSLLDVNSHEKLMDLKPDAFLAAGRADRDAPAGHKIPQVAMLDFQNMKKTGSVVPGEAARIRDERMDRVANAVAEAINAMPYWRAEVAGGREGKPDVLGGALPDKYPSKGGREYGEAYNLINVHIPRVGDETFALLWKREFNDFELDGKPANYTQEQSELMLAFVDPKSKKLEGSGYGLDGTGDDWRTWDAGKVTTPIGFFSETNPRKVSELVDRLAEEIVNNLTEFKALNER